MSDSVDTDIQRINELSQMGRSVWISMLLYLAFIFVTILGMDDADLLVSSRRTDLPIAGIGIPTTWFLALSPVVGASLYVYLHQYLLKLWDAIHDAPATVNGRPLGDCVNPWLVTELGTKLKGEEATRRRPLGLLTRFVTRLLVWYAGGLVLLLFWIRSLPLQNMAISILCLICLFVTLYAGMVSSAAARRTLLGRFGWLLRGTRLLFAVGLVASLTGITFFDVIVDPAEESATLAEALPGNGPNVGEKVHRINVPDEELVPLPPEWRSHAVARKAFRVSWCAREALPMNVCDHYPEPQRPAPPQLAFERRAWCAEHDLPLTAGACERVFSEYDARFLSDWYEERTSNLRALPDLVLRDRDLREANASGAGLTGAEFHSVDLRGADFTGANLEGVASYPSGTDPENPQANSDMSWADFTSAHMELTRLAGVTMTGAAFNGTNLNYADLSSTELSGASFAGAVLVNSDLSGSVLAGANLSGAKLFRAWLFYSDLSGAILDLADLREVDIEDTVTEAAIARAADMRGMLFLTQAQLDGMVGDAMTLLPDTPAPDTGLPYTIPSCRTGFPADLLEIRSGLEQTSRNPVTGVSYTEGDLTSALICPDNRPPRATGTPLALDAPYPEGHPLRTGR